MTCWSSPAPRCSSSRADGPPCPRCWSEGARAAFLQATGALRIGALERLDDVLYDARVRATMPQTLDSRIVDVDEKSLAEVGRWPWRRKRLAEQSAQARQGELRAWGALLKS